MWSTIVSAWAHFTQNWKSTAANFLTLVVITGGYFAVIPVATLQEHGITQNEVFWGTVICGLAKLYVGLITNDAKSTQAAK
jgi:hypothetical protein